MHFIKTALYNDKCEYFFKIMWDSNSGSQARDNIQRIVTRALIKGIKLVHGCREDPERRVLPVVVELHNMLIEIVRIFFDVLKNRKFQQKWGRLEEFFMLIENVTTEDYQHAEFMLSHELKRDGEDDVVTKLCDFMM